MISRILISTPPIVRQVNARPTFLPWNALDVVSDGLSGLDSGRAGHIARMAQQSLRTAETGVHLPRRPGPSTPARTPRAVPSGGILSFP